MTAQGHLFVILNYINLKRGNNQNTLLLENVKNDSELGQEKIYKKRSA